MIVRTPDEVAEALARQGYVIERILDRDTIIDAANRLEDKLDGVDVHTMEPCS